jgi:hypothetical protein
MSANIDVKEALVGMGVDGLKATAAASRYNSVESALNWVFGEGESVSVAARIFPLSCCTPCSLEFTVDTVRGHAFHVDVERQRLGPRAEPRAAAADRQ